MSKAKYAAYVQLMLKILPHVAKEKAFGLKGGTAINLFVRNLPRLSVDIDLTYVGRESRDEAIKNAEASLARIKSEIENPVIRGTIFESEDRDLVAKAEEQFGLSLSVPVVSIPDLYGGKIVAALDRQHPRDLFDIKLLFENEDLTSDIMKGFLVYLSSHNRPFHEVLNPTKKNMKKIFLEDFEGMTNIDFSYEDFENTRNRLVSKIQTELSENQRIYLLSLQMGSPKWEFLDLAGVSELSAVKWKLENIKKMTEAKRVEAVEYLRKILKT